MQARKARERRRLALAVGSLVSMLVTAPARAAVTSTSTSRPTTTTTSTSTTRAPTTTSVTTTSRPTTTTMPAVRIRTSSINLRDHTGPPAAPNRRRFVFQAATSADPIANAVVVSPRGSPGDPTAFGAVLAVYDATGSNEIVVVALPAAGWTAYGTAPMPAGYRWTAPSRSSAVTRVIVRSNRIRIRGGGAAWTYTLDESAQGAVAVWLRFGTAPPWCASAPAKSSGSPPSTAAYDRVDRFVGVRNTPPPAACPPL